MSRLRIEVEEYTATGGRRGVVLYVDDETVTSVDMAKARPIIDQAVVEVAASTGHTAAWARDALFAETALHLADVAAYERVAASRGLLAL